MTIKHKHTYHIPVLGTGYTLDTPVHVAHLGVSSVISLVDDTIMEQMREFYSKKFNLPFKAISTKTDDCRAKRISSYLDMVDDIVRKKVKDLTDTVKFAGSELEKYVNMLPDTTEIKSKFNLGEKGAKTLEGIVNWVNTNRQVGSIDVNIMTKLDQARTKDGKELPIEYNDAHAALRGYANSKLSSSLVLSAGMSPRLYSYLEKFKDFFPNAAGEIKKNIILKVSDFRSALIQGKMLAAKGIWVSEYRIESGVNCGGHAFPTNGVLLGPILEEFRTQRDKLYNTCLDVYKTALVKKDLPEPQKTPELKVSAQGGIGNAEEHNLLLDHYGMDSVGWGTPFMLVPEVVSIDKETLNLLADAGEEELFMSGLSPLGVPFNSVKWASMSRKRQAMAKEGKPGMPCSKGYLKYNTEYTDKAICTSSRQYQTKKLEELRAMNLSEQEFNTAYEKIVEPECLCIGLGSSSLLSKGIQPAQSDKVTVCPGPNLAYFSKISTLAEMTDHIYGRLNLLNEKHRPHMFLKELKMYLDIFANRTRQYLTSSEDKKELKQLEKYQKNLLDGVAYYKELFSKGKVKLIEEMENMLSEYPLIREKLQG